MTARGVLCVECGKTVPAVIRGSCPDCFTAKTPLIEVPQVLDVELCSHCDARHVGSHWIDPAQDDPLEDIRAQAARAAVRVHEKVDNPLVTIAEKPQDDKHFLTIVRLEGDVEGTPVDATVEMTVRMRRSVCDRCSRMFGGYYAATIQLRASDRDVSKVEIERAHKIIGTELDRLRATGNREAFLTKSGAVPGGFDYYMGDIEGTRAISRTLIAKMGASLQETAKLVGRKEGMDVYRVTFLVRVRLFAPGDFAVLHAPRADVPVQVSTFERGKAIVFRLTDHMRDRVDEENLTRIGGSEELSRCVVVSRSATQIQVMDPVTFRVSDIPVPEGWSEDGETVWALRQDDHLYLPRVAPPAPEPPQPKKRRRNRAPGEVPQTGPT